MTREHTLTSDKNVAVFHKKAKGSLFNDLSKKTELQRQFLSRLRDALRSKTPGRYVEKPYKGVENVSQFRAGDVMRGYCVFADEPESYNIFYFLEVTDHGYDRYPVAKYDRRAGEVIETVRGLSGEEEVEGYLEDRDAFDAGDVERLLGRI
ncbi:hypothetical protein EGH25_03910 [Haladaptatus sp. F3-133]|jgi:hypothetical protein|uniref:Uncharacterized protein n=1 Tax=Halorutilus salinus TaxID=2487751 RepID=A0A9Q4C4W9_9EURY|nr:hypothetical protein [Halorutilus salinus]MCX2818499.1 hypothetical protein [Halorutilus salinus]